MNEQLVKYKEWWNALADREKRTLSIGVVVGGLLLFYLIIWSPYLNRVDELRKQIISQQKTLSWMQTADKEMTQLEREQTPKAAALSPVELLSYLQKQLSASGLDVTQLKQISNDSVQLQFKKVDFDRLIAFLTKVAKEQAVSMTHMSAVAEGSPGMVNADVTIKI